MHFVQPCDCCKGDRLSLRGGGEVECQLSYSSAAEKCHLTDEHVTTLEWKSP